MRTTRFFKKEPTFKKEKQCNTGYFIIICLIFKLI